MQFVRNHPKNPDTMVHCFPLCLYLKKKKERKESPDASMHFSARGGVVGGGGEGERREV